MSLNIIFEFVSIKSKYQITDEKVTKESQIFLWWIVELDSVGDTTLILETLSTGYSFWDWLCNFLHKFTWIVLSVHKLNKLGKFW